MPVEIKELVIRAVVTPTTQSVNKRQNTAEDAKDVIIEACVRQVLKILHKSRDR